jgi:hypothetical protein
MILSAELGWLLAIGFYITKFFVNALVGLGVTGYGLRVRVDTERQAEANSKAAVVAAAQVVL